MTLTPVAGFTGDVALSCEGLPSGANCSFAPPAVPNGSGQSTLTISTTASVPVGTYPVQIVGTSAALSHERMAALSVATTAGATTANILPGALSFAPQLSSTSSAAQVAMLTNTGSAALGISGVSIVGSNAGDFAAQSNNCGSSLAAYASCEVMVAFTPTTMGRRTASLSVSSNATGSPHMVALSGTGQDFSLGASGTPSATVTAGQTATYMLSLAAGGGFTGNVALTCSGAPAKTTCSVSPTSVSLSGTTAAAATITVKTTAASQVWLPVGTDSWRMIGRLWMLAWACLVCMLVIAGWYTSRRGKRFRWSPALAVILLLCAGLTLTSCGGGSSGGGGGTGGSVTGTEAGTYTITVSASSTAGASTVTHTTKLTLIVQ